MTDLEKLKQCFVEIGIKYEEKTVHNYGTIISLEVKEYADFNVETEFNFDEYGKFIRVDQGLKF